LQIQTRYKFAFFAIQVVHFAPGRHTIPFVGFSCNLSAACDESALSAALGDPSRAPQVDASVGKRIALEVQSHQTGSSQFGS